MPRPDLVATAKLALLPYVCGMMLLVISATLWSARHQLNTRGPILLLVLVVFMFLLAVGPEWLRNIARYSNPVYPAGIPLVGGGIFVSDFGKIDGEPDGRTPDLRCRRQQR